MLHLLLTLPSTYSNKCNPSRPYLSSFGWLWVFWPPWHGVLSTMTHFAFLLSPAPLTLCGVAWIWPGSRMAILLVHFIRSKLTGLSTVPARWWAACAPPSPAVHPSPGGTWGAAAGAVLCSRLPALASRQPSLLRSRVNTTRGYISASFPQLQVISSVLLHVFEIASSASALLWSRSAVSRQNII